jgi:ABC-type Fe3+ transport system substrate-binding protein
MVYDKVKFNKSDVDTYEKLADPKFKGSLCIRSGSHPYNLSLFGALTEHLGPQKTEAWAKSLVDNMARSPKGGDTDQIRAVAAGECGVAVTNSYYLARLMRSSKPEDRAVAEKVGVVFPKQLGHPHERGRRRCGTPRQKQRQRGAVFGVLGQPSRPKPLCQWQQRVACGQRGQL